jgi:hypothetical protein
MYEVDAEDVTQTVLRKLSKQMRGFRYDRARSLRAWLPTLVYQARSDFGAGSHRGVVASGDSGALVILENLEARLAGASDSFSAAFEPTSGRERRAA